MTGWLNQDFIFGNEMVPSLAATAPLADQGYNLENLLSAAGGNQYILIGHSQGGLISRYVAQYFQTQSANTVQGVITVDTPHLGAAITQTGPSAIGNGVASLGDDLYWSFGCFTPYDNDGCYMSAIVADAATQVAQDLVDSVGALNDLTPGSIFLTQLNAATENFQKASIVGKTDQKWLPERVLDTWLTGLNPDDPFGEDWIAKATQVIYDVTGVYLGIDIGNEVGWEIECYVDGGAEDGDPDCDYDPYLDYIAQDSGIIKGMDKLNDFWDNLVAPDGSGSDGFVQNSSQVYPSSAATKYTIDHADSHQAATRSPLDHNALAYLLTSVYKVAIPTPISQCSFSSNQSSVSVPASGGVFYVEISTGSGCQWSATSQDSWITIESNSTSGANTATITFDVQPITSSVPRYSTIWIGNGFTWAVVTINESSTCSYSLSPSPTIGFSSLGGNDTVQVTTQPGCVWSAASNQSWLTIQSGTGSGSGSGPFGITAAGNAPSSENPAIINVMGQTISVSETGSFAQCNVYPICYGGKMPPEQ
jgi:hypothetical protein